MNMQTISLPERIVPPMLERALGYEGAARLVAFWFDVGGDIYYSDGDIRFPGDRDAANEFFHHPLILPYIRSYHLGSLEEPPAFCLLLDRESRALSIVPIADAQRRLCEQWGGSAQTDVLVVSEDEWDLLVSGLMARFPQEISPEEWREQQRLVAELRGWLAMASQEVRQ